MSKTTVLPKKKAAGQSNVIAFPVSNYKTAGVPLNSRTDYFHIPAEFAAHFNSSSDILARAEHVAVFEGDLVLFHLNIHSPWRLGKMFHLDEWFIRDESNKTRLYPVLDGTRKIIKYTEIPAKNAKKFLGRREISRLTADELPSFDANVVGRIG